MRLMGSFCKVLRILTNSTFDFYNNVLVNVENNLKLINVSEIFFIASSF